MIKLRKNKRKKKKKQTKSVSVKYFESLENRGPLCPGSPYEAWTRKIRHDMEEAGTWITGFMDAGPRFIAEYISRLQKEFKESKRAHDGTFKYLYCKIRIWGLRQKKFEMGKWVYQVRTTCAWVASYRYSYVKGEEYAVKPYVKYVFNDHGAGI
jgi:hypothetical protein